MAEPSGLVLASQAPPPCHGEDKRSPCHSVSTQLCPGPCPGTPVGCLGSCSHLGPFLPSADGNNTEASGTRDTGSPTCPLGSKPCPPVVFQGLSSCFGFATCELCFLRSVEEANPCVDPTRLPGGPLLAGVEEAYAGVTVCWALWLFLGGRGPWRAGTWTGPPHSDACAVSRLCAPFPYSTSRAPGPVFSLFSSSAELAATWATRPWDEPKQARSSRLQPRRLSGS